MAGESSTLRNLIVPFLGNGGGKSLTMSLSAARLLSFTNFHQHQRWNLWIPRSRRCSFLWSGLFPSLDAFKTFLSSLVENGDSTLFWLDNWYNGCAPKFRWRREFQLSTSPFVTVREVILDLPSVVMRADPVLCMTSSRILSAS